MADDSPTTTVQLWCHTCRGLVTIRPTHISRPKGQPVVHHVTPAAWTAHRQGHAA